MCLTNKNSSATINESSIRSLGINMNLIAYLKKNNITQDSFAKSLGITQSAVGQWVRGELEVSPKQAIRIQDLTSGNVTIKELVSIEPLPTTTQQSA